MFEFYQPIPPSKEIQENQIPTNPTLPETHCVILVLKLAPSE